MRGDGCGGWSGYGGAAGAERWGGANGMNGALSLAHSAESGGGAVGAGERQLPARPRRYGTYEREHQERSSVLHYLTVATLLRSTPPGNSPAASAANNVGGGSGSGGGSAVGGGSSSGGGGDNATASATATSVPPHPAGATASELLAAMRESPWQGWPSAGAGTRREWAAWLERLTPTLERHLRWLAVDGLALQSNGGGDSLALAPGGGVPSRFLAVLPDAGQEAGAEPGGNESAGRLSSFPAGGRAVAAGGAGGGPGAGPGSPVAGASLLAGGMRFMKSRPIKMVKPWR